MKKLKKVEAMRLSKIVEAEFVKFLAETNNFVPFMINLRDRTLNTKHKEGKVMRNWVTEFKIYKQYTNLSNRLVANKLISHAFVWNLTSEEHIYWCKVSMLWRVVVADIFFKESMRTK